MFDSLLPHGLKPTMLLSPRDFPGKSTGVGCHFFLQGIFMTQGIQREFPVSPTLAGGFFTTELHNGCEKKSESASLLVVPNTLRPHGLLARQAPLSMEFPRQE